MPDVNVLVYAHRRDEDPAGRYRRWLEDLASRPTPFALSVLVAVGFVRIVTSPRIYRDPTPLPQALGVVELLAGRASCRIVAPGEDHLDGVLRLCRHVGAVGKQVADAQHAALAVASGCTWVTRDADFALFAPAGLSWQHLSL